jgi:hypothetical protein
MVVMRLVPHIILKQNMALRFSKLEPKATKKTDKEIKPEALELAIHWGVFRLEGLSIKQYLYI